MPVTNESVRTIDTLVSDIYEMLEQERSHVTPEGAKLFGEKLANIIYDKLQPQRKNYLRLSNLGSRCLRKLWYSINTPAYAETLSGPARIKFLIGDITEAVALELARLSGHSVTDEQRTVEVHGVPGHLDAIIDGEVTDVKSASPFSFKKFRLGLTPGADAFGYLTQLGSYSQAVRTEAEQPDEVSRGVGSFLAVDKVLGTLHLDRHSDLPSVDESYVQFVRETLAEDEPPARAFEDEPDGQYGNRVLSLPCSYCEFKTKCWAGLKTYHYARGPKYFTKVAKEPRVASE